MRQTVKEKLNDKGRKMIDLIYDEVCDKGEKNIVAAFIDKKTQLKYELTLGLKVSDPEEEEVVEEPVSQDPETPTDQEDSTETSTDQEGSTETPTDQEGSTEIPNPITDPEGTGESDGS